MPRSLQLWQGDITQLAVGAIVNAANESLLGGGGVDGAIHRAAGPELREACAQLGGCRPGEAKMTPGFRLPARYVIHTVGPRWRGGDRDEPETLTSCYRSALDLAHQHQLTTIAFPSISTGIFGYPITLAAPLAIATVRSWLQVNEAAIAATFVCFDRTDFQIYDETMRRASE